MKQTDACAHALQRKLAFNQRDYKYYNMHKTKLEKILVIGEREGKISIVGERKKIIIHGATTQCYKLNTSIMGMHGSVLLLSDD